MRFNHHGGGCCGATHVQGLSFMDKIHWSRLKEKVKWAKNHGHLLEVIITDQQIMRDQNLLTQFKKLGFRHVSRFLNGNSGNYCNVFHFHRNPRSKLDY